MGLGVAVVLVWGSLLVGFLVGCWWAHVVRRWHDEEVIDSQAWREFKLRVGP
jgi:hypothetical protein